MKKFKLFSTYESEENWLAKQAQEGNIFIKKGLLYKFVKQTPQKVSFGIDYRTFRKKVDYIDYLSLFEDTGWQHKSGSMYSGTQYFTRESAEQEDNSIFSDRPSPWVRYKKKAASYLQSATIILMILVVEHLLGQMDLSMILHPSRLFLTPGLWEKTGQAFWNSFLFELPFALIFRLLPLLLILALIILSFISGLWALHIYRSHKENP